jgi:S-adenosylmethionine:tRNA ribosyltransferase-isomerase
MRLSDFHFELPSELIARYPLAKRSAGRLLKVNETLHHHFFSDIVDFLNEGDVLVFNDTKVIPARLSGQKNTGGQVELLVERILDEKRILAQLRASKSPTAGQFLFFAEGVRFQVLHHHERFYELHYEGKFSTILEALETIGQIPLPPYMQRKPEEEDKIRYQTIYARHNGSVAAPTAGLHFDETLLHQLKEKKIEMGYLTLHIGAGTFVPVRVENITDHRMHPEYLEISATLCEQIKTAKARGKRIVAVGTTSLRALETACQSGEIAPYHGETSIFIYPGFTFHCVDVLITNLHLPQSTLLMLVCAFGRYEKVMEAYRAAVKNAYRFYSYGDAMWVEKT